MKHKGKILAAVAAGVALLTVAASYFGSVTVVSTMHESTNYIHTVMGNHQASVVRKISPSNLVAVQNTVILPRTNLAGLYVSGTAATPGQISLYESNGTFATIFKAPDALTNDFTYIFPTNHPPAGRTNLAVKSVSGTTITLDWVGDNAGSGALTVKTNGVTLGTESTLNLVAGANTTLTGTTGTGSNQVTIAATGGGAQVFNPEYPNEPIITNSYTGRIVSQGSDSGAVGQLGLFGYYAGSASGQNVSATDPRYTPLNTSTVSNNLAQVYTVQSLWSSKTNYFRANLKITNCTDIKFWCGFSDAPTGSAMADHAPGSRYGAAFRLFSATSSNEVVFQCVNFSNAVASSVSSGVVATNNYFLFEILSTKDDVRYFINQLPVATNTLILPSGNSVGLAPFASIYAGSDTTAKTIRFVDIYVKGTR